jgi:hypothetical protein
VGIGFVLLFWGLLLGAAAVVCGAVLALWSWWNHRRTLGPTRVFKPLAAGALPFLLLVYGGAAFAAYAVWCEAIRDVDPGIGDSWRVPIGDEWYFCMIDVPDNGYLLKGGCTGAPIVHGITELRAANHVVVGNSESSGAFRLDTRTGTLQTFANMDAALDQMTPRPILESANDFYANRRWGKADVFAAVLIGLPAIAAAIFWYRWFIRSPREEAVPLK